MPRIKKIPSGYDGPSNALMNIELLRQYYHIEKKKLATMAHIGYGTLCNRYNNPQKFTLAELEGLSKALKTTSDKLLSKAQISLIG